MQPGTELLSNHNQVNLFMTIKNAEAVQVYTQYTIHTNYKLLKSNSNHIIKTVSKCLPNPEDKHLDVP